MPTIMTFIKEKYVQIAGLAALCALIWLVGPLISIANFAPLEPTLNRAIAIALLIICWVAWCVYELSRAGKKDRMLMTQITSAGAERAALEEARNEEVANLRRKFEDALQLLKTTRSKGNKSKHYLYEFPWYVIIGGPGTGKTTLLHNSGLQFPLADRLGKNAIKGVGGTRDCDWFFTDQAIFLDTAGRYTTQDSYQAVDKAAWSAFLDLLKKNRPMRPINGVMLVTSLSDLLQESEDERRQRARGLRDRIMELYNVLGNRFPIYMIFTKCDLVAGFTDFFTDLSQEERKQVWGETFPGDGAGQLEQNLSGFEANFDLVLSRIRQQVLKKMQQERDLHRRGLIMGFPQQITMTQPLVSLFLLDVFSSNRYETEPFLRGVYFTSATQEGTPIDRIMGALAKTYGMDRQEAPIFSGLGKSFFITRLLTDVIFPEGEVAGVDLRAQRRRRMLRWGAYTFVGLLVIGMSSLWFLSYLKNLQSIEKVDQTIQNYRSIPAPSGGDTVLKNITARLNAIKSAQDVYPAPRPWSMGIGLYQGEKILDAVNEAYKSRLLADLLPEINRRLKTQMMQIMQKADSSDSGRLYELLRTYLMIAVPEKMNRKQAGASIRSSWKLDLPGEEQVVENLSPHLNSLLTLLHSPLAYDRDFVENVRRRLKAVPLAHQIYAHLKSVAAADHPDDFQLLDVAPRLSKDFFIMADGRDFKSVSIPWLYTREGYNAFFRKKGVDLVQQALAEDWVLNQYSEQANVASLYDEVQIQYFADYELLWRKFLSNMTIRKPQGINDTINILDYLSGPDTPLRPLLQAVEKNTNLSESRETPAGGAQSDEPKGSPLAVQQPAGYGFSSNPARRLAAGFDPLNRLVQPRGSAPPMVEDVIKSIHEVSDVLGQITSGASSEEQALRLAKERMAGFGVKDAIMKANLEFARLPEPLQGWLKGLTVSGWGITLEKAKAELNSMWKNDVYLPYSTGLKGRYPLSRNSRDDITMTDFCRFFGPKGTMDRFFEANLKSFVDTSGSEWRQVSVENQGMRLNQEIINQFRYAATIRDAFFDSADASPNIRFQLKPVSLDSNVASFRINLDGHAEEYAHGPPIPANFQWPGPQSNLGVVLTFTTFDGRTVSQVQEGPWAWLKTLDKAMFEKTSLPDVFIVTFQVEGYKARYELRANSVHNPFNLVELLKFNCPESL